MAMHTMALPRKVKTFHTLVQQRKFKDILHASIKYAVRVYPYRLVEFDVENYSPPIFLSKIRLTCRMGNDEDMKKMFELWPDSREEYERHREVYYSWGFKKCMFFFNRDTGELVHFIFILTYDDLDSIKRHLPMTIYGFLSDRSAAFIEWAYTFQKHRMKGIYACTIPHIFHYFRGQGVKKVFTHMARSNINSVRMTAKAGCNHTADIYQIQFFAQKKHSGLYLIRKT